MKDARVIFISTVLSQPIKNGIAHDSLALLPQGECMQILYIYSNHEGYHERVSKYSQDRWSNIIVEHNDPSNNNILRISNLLTYVHYFVEHIVQLMYNLYITCQRRVFVQFKTLQCCNNTMPFVIGHYWASLGPYPRGLLERTSTSLCCKVHMID